MLVNEVNLNRVMARYYELNNKQMAGFTKQEVLDTLTAVSHQVDKAFSLLSGLGFTVAEPGAPRGGPLADVFDAMRTAKQFSPGLIMGLRELWPDMYVALMNLTDEAQEAHHE